MGQKMLNLHCPSYVFLQHAFYCGVLFCCYWFGFFGFFLILVIFASAGAPRSLLASLLTLSQNKVVLLHFWSPHARVWLQELLPSLSTHPTLHQICSTPGLKGWNPEAARARLSETSYCCFFRQNQVPVPHLGGKMSKWSSQWRSQCKVCSPLCIYMLFLLIGLAVILQWLSKMHF